ncbi:hypothetical protein ABFS82_13G117500 [Erythranthe guttata]|nr:PREDICTED: transcription factor bHLH112-like [Erythranthe guttata]|eukprot:XP_012849357.1 PREDICTED: transcription factor bHLH112-like [Erythranthe guttata]
MAEELFHGGVCGGGANWWNNSTRNTYSSSSLCSSLANRDLTTTNMKSNTRSSDADSASDGSCSSTVVIQDVLKPNQTLQMVGISPDDHWINNQDLLHNNGRSDQNYSNILDSSMNYWQENDWISATSNLTSQDSNSVINSLNQTFDQLNSSNGFPLMNSASYSSYDSSLLQTLFDETDSNALRTQQSLLDNREFNYSSSAENYQVNSNEFLPMENPSFAKQQQLWNSTAADLSTNDVRSSFLPSSSQSQFLPSSVHCKKPNLPSFSVKHQNEEASVPKKASNEPSFKRPRIETPSPLPTFKVRKEKLGDRITALQQLVSPFGKTDTASVLHEAIEYIKFLHDQVNELSSPYLKHRPSPVQRLQAEDKEGVMQDLKTRGLCLVPVTSTFPVAQTPADFWTPTFGGSFK